MNSRRFLAPPLRSIINFPFPLAGGMPRRKGYFSECMTNRSRKRLHYTSVLNGNSNRRTDPLFAEINSPMASVQVSGPVDPNIKDPMGLPNSLSGPCLKTASMRLTLRAATTSPAIEKISWPKHCKLIERETKLFVSFDIKPRAAARFRE